MLHNREIVEENIENISSHLKIYWKKTERTSDRIIFNFVR